jgi:hypothetical protein
MGGRDIGEIEWRILTQQDDVELREIDALGPAEPASVWKIANSPGGKSAGSLVVCGSTNTHRPLWSAVGVEQAPRPWLQIAERLSARVADSPLRNRHGWNGGFNDIGDAVEPD